MYYPLWVLAISVYLTCDQTSGAFLQAISAALATIPLTGGPIAMTAGLAGVKLAVGSKLLYYLGFFSRGQKTSVTTAKSLDDKLKRQSSLRNFPQRYSVPLPYMFATGGGFRQPQDFSQVLSSQQFSVGQPSPSELMKSYLTRQETGHGRLFPASAMYESQGSHSQTDLQNSGMDYSSFPERQVTHETSTVGKLQLDLPAEIKQEASDEMNISPEGGGENDVDSFFNFLGEMDDNMCISRLLCDIGADPDFLGEFSQNINNIISSLEVPPGSRAYHYVSIMEQGREQNGGCAERFGHHCTDSAYEIVRSVAPTVSFPPNLEDLNV